ncbi:MAG: DUF4303 domain-containing protein [Polyangiaceae bacterium]|nr:DUF4303 domain-containing protein [Polyangiaceae bacterium]
MNHANARAAAVRYLEQTLGPSALGGLPITIVDELTQTHRFGWVFFYDSVEHQRTGDVAFALGGNAPLIVERSTGRVLVTGTAEPLSAYLTRYRDSGDPHGELGTTVVLTGADAEADVVAALRTVRNQTGLGLATAKQHIDRCRGGQSAEIETASGDAANRLVDELVSHGFQARRAIVRRGPSADAVMAAVTRGSGLSTAMTLSRTLLAEVRRVVRDAAKNAWRELRAARPNDTFYYYVLWTTGVVHRPAPSACSEEGLAQVVAAYRQSGSGMAAKELRWSENDSPFDLAGDHCFARVTTLFESLGDPYERTDAVRRQLLEAVVQALRDLDEEGFFGAGRERDAVVINVTMPGEEDEAETVARARTLNPRGALTAYARALRR